MTPWLKSGAVATSGGVPQLCATCPCGAVGCNCIFQFFTIQCQRWLNDPGYPNMEARMDMATALANPFNVPGGLNISKYKWVTDYIFTPNPDDMTDEELEDVFGEGCVDMTVPWLDVGWNGWFIAATQTGCPAACLPLVPEPCDRMRVYANYFRAEEACSPCDSATEPIFGTCEVRRPTSDFPELPPLGFS